MHYIALIFLFVLLGLIILKEWVTRSRPSKKNGDLLLKTAKELISLHNSEASLPILSNLLKSNLGGVEASVLYAQALRSTQQLPEAILYLNQVLRTYPNHLPLLREKGKILLEQGYAHEALQAFETCETILVGEEDIFAMASALFHEGHAEEAWLYLADLLPESKEGRTFALAGDSLFQLKEYTQATTFYFKAQCLGWNNHGLLTRLGYALLYTGQIQEAECHFRSIVAHDSSDVATILGFGASLEAQKKYQAALEMYQNSKAWDLGDGQILRQAGFCAVYTRQYSFAEVYLKEAIQRGHASAKTLTYYGYALERLKHWNDAEKVYLELVKQYPDHVAGYRALSWIYGVGLSKQIDADTGLAMAQRALQMQPDHTSWELLSACEARAGNFTKAHDIQEQLSSQTEDHQIRQRRRHAMRKLRQRIPLDETLVCRAA